MSSLLEGYSVLIVDGRSLSAADISNRLSCLGAKVHVVANAKCAQAVVRSMRLNVALIGHHYRDCPKELKRALDEYGVPYITTATALKSKSNNHYEKLFSVALQPTAIAADTRYIGGPPGSPASRLPVIQRRSY